MCAIFEAINRRPPGSERFKLADLLGEARKIIAHKKADVTMGRWNEIT